MRNVDALLDQVDCFASRVRLLGLLPVSRIPEEKEVYEQRAAQFANDAVRIAATHGRTTEEILEAIQLGTPDLTSLL